jgi:hypothetical protein
MDPAESAIPAGREHAASGFRWSGFQRDGGASDGDDEAGPVGEGHRAPGAPAVRARAVAVEGAGGRAGLGGQEAAGQVHDRLLWILRLGRALGHGRSLVVTRRGQQGTERGIMGHSVTW